MLQRVIIGYKILIQFGLGWIVFRLYYGFVMRTGVVRRKTPEFGWQERPLDYWVRPGTPTIPLAYAQFRNSLARKFLFNELPTLANQVWNTSKVIDDAEAILAGNWTYFEHKTYDLGFPPNWRQEPETNKQVSGSIHWSRVERLKVGDIKLFWELNRFSFSYTLARAYAYSGKEEYVGAFWALVEDWAEANPPHMGPNWMCSQEASIRLIAWCFALYAFIKSPHTTPERLSSLAVMIAVHAQRIERFLAYARSQGGNHIVTEGAALWTVGLIFPEFASADKWLIKGRQILENEAPEQIYEDGAYEMHSFNYHQSVLHSLYISVRLGELNDSRLDNSVYDAISRSIDFLHKFMDHDSGQWPIYGRNDSSLLLPITTCDQRDFHPTIQLGHFILTNRFLFQEGPWDEAVLWFFGPSVFSGAARETQWQPHSSSFPIGGYYRLQGKHSWIMIRCARFLHRPYEADQLHIDVWWHGINVICEAGTYRYNSEGVWNHGANKTIVHNTVTVDDQDQMLRIGRFLWLDWSDGRVVKNLCSSRGELEYWEGAHEGYNRLKGPVKHTRGVLRLGEEHWLILDYLASENTHDYRQHWLFPDLSYELDRSSITLLTERGPYRILFGIHEATSELQVFRAAEGQLNGWRSLYYNEKHPAVSVINHRRCDTVLFWSLLGPPVNHIRAVDNMIKVEAQNWIGEVKLSKSGELMCAGLIESVRFFREGQAEYLSC